MRRKGKTSKKEICNDSKGNTKGTKNRLSRGKKFRQGMQYAIIVFYCLLGRQIVGQLGLFCLLVRGLLIPAFSIVLIILSFSIVLVILSLSIVLVISSFVVYTSCYAIVLLWFMLLLYCVLIF
jgi:hypothetical protein